MTKNVSVMSVLLCNKYRRCRHESLAAAPPSVLCKSHNNRNIAPNRTNPGPEACAKEAAEKKKKRELRMARKVSGKGTFQDLLESPEWVRTAIVK